MKIDDVLDVLEALEAAGVRYAVFGGMAMAAHGLNRATEVLDIFIPPDAHNVALLKQALMRVFNDPEIELISSDDLEGDYPAVRYGPPDVEFVIDIVSRLGDAFQFEDLDITRVSAGRFQIAVVTPETLYRMKRNTVRLRDRDDANRLIETFGIAPEKEF